MTQISTRWFAPPEPLLLERYEVHVWRACLNQSHEYIHQLHDVLAADEQVRAAKYSSVSARDHFIIARGLLRTILGRYQGQEPQQLRFQYGVHGKPALAGEDDGDMVRFNVSHAHELVLIAVTRDHEVGIDIEFVHRRRAEQQIAERFFSAQEVAMLHALPEHMQHEAFYHCWTRKEAYMKARGTGLALPLNRFTVSVSPEEPAVLMDTLHEPGSAASWTLEMVAPGCGYVAAIAVEGTIARVRQWQWT